MALILSRFGNNRFAGCLKYTPENAQPSRSLGMLRTGQPMLNLVPTTGLIKSMCASQLAFAVRREAVGKLLVVICQFVFMRNGHWALTCSMKVTAVAAVQVIDDFKIEPSKWRGQWRPTDNVCVDHLTSSGGV